MKNDKLRKVLLIFSVLVLISGAGLLGYRFVMYGIQEKEALEAAELARAEALQNEALAERHKIILEDEKAIAMADLDFTELVKINPETLGWIYISGTDMSYPITQHEDNQYYLNTTWDLKNRFYGSIYLECMCSPDFSDFNTIIYGHNLYNGGMFHDLRNFKKQEFYEEHPYVYIRTADTVRRYEIFSCFEAKPKSPVFYLKIEDAEHKQDVIDFAAQESLISAPAKPSIYDKIITLSTCTGNGSHSKRIIVQAVLTESIGVDDLKAISK